jgi:hypothetical protein
MSSEACRGLEAPCLKPGSVAPLFVWFDLNCGTWGRRPLPAYQGPTREPGLFPKLRLSAH